jgi:soluble lytic murein transglycosylase
LLLLTCLIVTACSPEGRETRRDPSRDARGVATPQTVDSDIATRDGADADAETGADADAETGADADAETGADEVTWEEVRRLVRAGDDEPALAALDRLPQGERDTTGARYLRGRLLERLRRPAEAIEAFELDSSSLSKRVARDLDSRRAALMASANQCPEARPLLQKLGVAPGRAGASARTLAAECALELGEHEAAAGELRALLARSAGDIDTWKVRRLLAEALAVKGEIDEAKSTLHELLVRSPERSEASAVEARIRELGGEVSFTTAERIGRAERLLARRQVDAALVELDASGRPSRPVQLTKWLHLRGMALFRSRHNYAEAAEVLAESGRRSGPNAIDDEFHAARALSRADRDNEAIAAYQELVKSHPTHARAAEAEYLAAWLDIRHERTRGERNMDRFLKGPRARLDQELRREATWHLAFRAFERGRHARAAGLFEQYARMGRSGLIRGRGLYWKARALELQGERDEAVEAYHAAIAVEALHWYALLSRQRLIALGEEPGDPFQHEARSAAPASPLPPIPLPGDVAFFASLGLDDDALEELQRQEVSIRATAPEGRALEALIRAYHQVGGFRRAYRMTGTQRETLEERPGPGNRWVWEGAYPRPHDALVRELAREQGVEPSHVYATMRQESGYHPGVVSHADAIGLLQMLPSTARTMSKQMGVPFRREQLFDPEWNLRYGIAEIGSLHRDFDGRLPLTIAAYNAGANRVRRWLSETGEIELDRFVERIPFDETRGYVRRVTSHYARYRYLEDPSRPWPLELPERVGPDSEETSDQPPPTQ